jgi:transcriptional regulator with XRE-family HTH domain
MSIAELATRVLASEPTIARLERGDPAVSLAVLFGVLEILGMTAEIDRLVEHDELGQAIADARLGRPRRSPKPTLADEL